MARKTSGLLTAGETVIRRVFPPDISGVSVHNARLWKSVVEKHHGEASRKNFGKIHCGFTTALWRCPVVLMVWLRSVDIRLVSAEGR
jgi:hypothetical protein